MALSRFLSLTLLVCLVLPSPSFTATFSSSEDSSSGEIDLTDNECPDDTDTVISPLDSVTTTFSSEIDFEDPAISSTVTFKSVSGDFPFGFEIRYQCSSTEGRGCSEEPINMTFANAEELDNFIYDAIILPGSCPELTGPSIRCSVAFCSLEATNAKFTANMTSLAQETLFKSDKTIPLPGPKVEVGEGETTDVLQLFTFDLSKDKGKFTLSLDDDKAINDYFSSIGVNGEDNSLEDVDSSTYTVTVKEKTNYFSLLEANTTANVAGDVKFEEKKIEDDDHFWLWVGVAAAGVVVLVIILVIILYCCCCKKPADYEEVA